jgi:hypothetical protein
MSDPGNRAGEVDPEAEAALEAGELRRRHEEEFRREREKRAADADAKDEPREPAPDVHWSAPVEMRQGKRRTLVRVLLFVFVLAALYLGARVVTEALFAPRLTLIGPALPSGAIPPEMPVTIGLYARNDRMREGAAYALLVLADGREIEGPVVMVPPGDSVLVPVQASFPVGDHVVSLVLFDAWKENVQVSAVRGLVVRAGASQVDVLDASLPPVAVSGEPITLTVTFFNPSDWSASVVPLAVFTSDGEPGQPIEVELARVEVPAGQSITVNPTIAPGAVPPGRYHVAVVPVTEAGERAGTGVHGLPLEVPPPGPPRQ